MRFSIDPTDPGFTDFTKYFRVTLNGRPIHNVITADEERCFLERYKTDFRGEITQEREKMSGIVRIELFARPAPCKNT